jgi:predicted ATP-dependent endonuclease of OLD family
MKIESLALENFKIFKKAEFNFKKITILAGANSAGKTSVLNALASIIQNNNADSFPFNYHNYGENVHLGGFKDIINNGDISNPLGLTITFTHNAKKYSLHGKFCYSERSKKIITKEIIGKSDFGDIHVKKKDGSHNTYEVLKIIHTDPSNAKQEQLMKSIFSSLTSFIIESELPEKNKKTKNIDFEKEIEKSFTSSKDWENFTPKKGHSLLSALEGKVYYSQHLTHLNKGIHTLQNNIHYVGPIRPYPSRHYFLQHSNEKLDSLGNNSFHLLIEWAKSEKNNFKKIISDLNFLKLADKISTSAIKEELIELAVSPCGQNKSVNISDAGFGLSQILPILIANTAAKPESTLLINQPEVHLHPSCQAQLANYFSKESEKRNFIIETHSEYLINRFRILVQKGELKEEDINIIYIDRNKEQIKIHDISILKSGSLKNAPKSFFDTYYADINELILGS